MQHQSGFDPIDLFQRSAERWPDRIGLLCEGVSLTYRELDLWSSTIARRLNAEAYGQRVAFIAEKRPGTYAAILGILKSGRSYVPLAPDAPSARWQEMIDKAEVRSMIGDAASLKGIRSVPLPQADDGPLSAAVPCDPQAEAYVLFTSGSTGGPKGVSVSRGNVAAYLGHVLSFYDFSEEDRFTQFFALTFDLSVHDLFVCWASGACLCVPDANAALRAAAFVRENRITVWFSVPSVVSVMQRMRSLGANALGSLRSSFFCGEALPWPLVDAFRIAAPQARIINLYGPTEATIAITGYEVPAEATSLQGLVPIGQVFSGSSTYVEGDELLLGGPQLSRGYVNDVSATQRAFIHRDGQRWYRTGDRVKEDGTGLLHFIGRMDDQVKVLGHRVEPAEVDASIASLLGNGSCATVPVVGPSSTRLVTFIDVPMDTEPLLERCRALLPAYMVPERIIILETLPLNLHGKVDRKQLMTLAANA